MRKVLFLMMAAAVIAPVSAQLCNYQISGTISNIINNQNSAVPGVYVSQPFTGTFSYTVLPYNASGIYDQNASLTLTLGSFTLSHLNKPVLITVVNNPVSATGKTDSFTYHATGTQGAYSYTRSGITLTDSTRTAFSSLELPQLLRLSAFTSAQVNLTGTKGTDGFNIIGNITTLTLIPEPATLALLAAALPLLRRRRKQ